MLADALVFSVDGEQYCWRDVILSAVQHGEWQDVEHRAIRGAACARHAEAYGIALPDGALDRAGREFRYAQDLVTAQSMEDWLRRHELTVQEWSAHLRREYLRARIDADIDSLVARYPISEKDATRLTLVDATCRGDLAAWARSLAQRAAAHASVADTAPAHDTLPVHLAPPAPPIRAILGGSDETVHTAARRLASIDASLAAFRGALVTERAISDYLNARQLDWVRFDCRLMSFPDESMAAEAALLLREDGEGFTSVYQVAHTAPRGTQFFIDQIDESMKDHFLGSRPGDLIGPVRIDDQYVLYQVEEKVLPTLRDDDVRRRAESGVLSSALHQQFEQRVVWAGSAVA
ncbi:MAG: hypothetical protein ABIY52_10100 [Gemmatimonadaceae bacterium]